MSTTNENPEYWQQHYPHLYYLCKFGFGQDWDLLLNTKNADQAVMNYLDTDVGGMIPNKVEYRGKNYVSEIVSDIIRFLNEFTDEKEVDQILLRGFHSGFGLVHAGEPMGGLLKLKTQLEAYVKEHRHDQP